MRALVLAGGKATRLRPLTEATPKAMTPVLGRPFLEHLLAWLRAHGTDDVTLLLGYLPDPIQAYFGDGGRFGVRLTYVVERDALGSGGAIKQLEPSLNEPFFALNGDVFTDMDLGAMQRAHEQHRAQISIYLHPVEDPSAYGVCAVDDAGMIRRFVEKPKREDAPSNLINAGVWLFQPSVLASIAAGRFTMVEQDLFPAMAEAGAIYGFLDHGYWMDAGTPDRYLQLHRDLLAGVAHGSLAIIERGDGPGLMLRSLDQQRRQGAPPRLEAGATLAGAVVLGDGALLAAGARVVGPATIGDRCRLGANVVVEDSVLWSDCIVEDGAVVRGSVLAAGSVVGAGATLDRCVLGEGARAAAGAVATNKPVNPGELLA
jgi:mannose-1-phosphate guanylyltransferase